MRVQLKSTSDSSDIAGIIPACAGTTHLIFQLQLRCRDHPRVCGYNASFRLLASVQLGSSPRVRVQHFKSIIHTLPTGIIPACAGTTGRNHFRLSLEQDHPRVCGYNNDKEDGEQGGLGSSPRVRVQHNSYSSNITTTRIIPACAGTTI